MFGRKRPPPPSVAETARAAWEKALEPLGVQRQKVVACLHGDMPAFGRPFVPSDAETVFATYRRFVRAWQDRIGVETDALTRAMVGAGLLLTGDLAGADAVVDALPATATTRRNGWCTMVPVAALRAAIPFPLGLGCPEHWIAGAPEQAGLRAWLADHRSRLQWHEHDGVYRLDGASG